MGVNMMVSFWIIQGFELIWELIWQLICINIWKRRKMKSDEILSQEG